MTERVDHPAWAAHVARLASIITKPMSTVAIQSAACFDFGWDYSFTVNVLAAGENKQLFNQGKIWRRATGYKAPNKHQQAKPERAPRQLLPGHCVICGDPYQRSGPAQRYCGEACRNQQKERRRKLKEMGDAA